MDLAKLCSLKSASVQLLGAALLSSWWSRQEMCCHKARVSRGFEEMKTDKILSETEPRLSMVVLCCPISWPVWKLPTTMPDSAGCCTLRRPSCCLKGARRASHFCHAVPCHADKRSEEISSFLFGKAPIKEDCHVAVTLLLLCFSLLFCLFMFVCAWFATFPLDTWGSWPVGGWSTSQWKALGWEKLVCPSNQFWTVLTVLHSVFIVPRKHEKAQIPVQMLKQICSPHSQQNSNASVTSFDVCKRSEPLTERKTSQAVFFRTYFLLSQMANLF